MKENLLYYLWLHPKWKPNSLRTTSGELLTVVHPGTRNQHAGPDFFNAQIRIGHQLWAGNVEMHTQSSDWYHHHHHKNNHYDNVILHVVWEYDQEVFDPNNKALPTLELRHIVNKTFLDHYQNWMKQNDFWVPCEHEIHQIQPYTFYHFSERLFLDRLEQKSKLFSSWLKLTKNDWEAVLFMALSKGFGLDVNNNAFSEMAHSIPFSVVRKAQHYPVVLEALFMGQAGLLSSDKEDGYFTRLKNTHLFWSKKHRLEISSVQAQYFRLRPPNFPTIRLAQLAQLYSTATHLFNVVSSVNDFQSIYNLLEVKTSEYWETHYVFGKPTSKKVKRLTTSFKDLIIINILIPFMFCYSRYKGLDKEESILEWAYKMKPEQNSVVEKYRALGLKIENALQSQAVLQLKKRYCNHKQCLQCPIGHELLLT